MSCHGYPYYSFRLFDLPYSQLIVRLAQQYGMYFCILRMYFVHFNSTFFKSAQVQVFLLARKSDTTRKIYH